MLVPIAATCQVAFWHLFVRHYTSTGLTEARKILGGAGPAVATLLASAIWASISLVDLGQEVVRRRKPPSALVTGFFFYMLTSFGQVSSEGWLLGKQQLGRGRAAVKCAMHRHLTASCTAHGCVAFNNPCPVGSFAMQMLGVLPRMLASLMAFLPVQREGWLSDSETLQRMTARPQTLVDALYSSNRDFLHALTLALAGEQDSCPAQASSACQSLLADSSKCRSAVFNHHGIEACLAVEHSFMLHL